MSLLSSESTRPSRELPANRPRWRHCLWFGLVRPTPHAGSTPAVGTRSIPQAPPTEEGLFFCAIAQFALRGSQASHAPTPNPPSARSSVR